MWVQLLGFIATNSSVMTEHRHAVCVGTSNDCIPQGSLCGVLAKNSCLPTCIHQQRVCWIPRRTTLQHGQWRRKMDPVSDLGSGGLAGYQRSSCSGIWALVFKLIHAAFYFAGFTSDSDVFWFGPQAVNPFSRRKKRNINRWLCMQPVAFIRHA